MEEVGERDPVTGRMTTGHDWNGITELNTPVPRVVIFFLVVTTIFSIVYWILMPSWPLGSTYTKGLLGIDQKHVVQTQLEHAAAQREGWMKQIASDDFAAIQANPALMQIVHETGKTLFGDNCAVCHGINGTGGKGFPNLKAAAWLWGGDPQTIYQTLTAGINSANAETRTSQMPAFGRDGVLNVGQIDDVVAYVRSLGGSTDNIGITPEKVARGKEVFQANCVACHGGDAKGNHDMGAPNLTDPVWIYGGDRQSITASVYGGRQGHMPSWQDRLSDAQRKILTLYVLSLPEQRS
ncbi:cytochrome-c oxidase, cbb3-type subunit III [Mesorhizobium sp. KR2-14]|uniref:cytochrome-c oxidase, cbb3-type subunit III n=1 Tax=Mesorhizobium sp. KR2-14 TaxID=3156610 RepID=UPI0032B57AF6